MTVRSLAEAVERTAISSPARGYRFIRDDKFESDFFSFSQLEERTRELAGCLQSLGLKKADRLALILPDSDQFVLMFLAALRAGVIPVPI